MVITSLTRNQVVEQSAREFESHRLRHEPVYGQCPQQALPFLVLFYALFRGHFFCFCRKRMLEKSLFYKAFPCSDSAVRRKLFRHFKCNRFFLLRFFKHAIHDKPGFDLRMEVKMRVNIRRGRERAVPKPYLDLLHGYPVCEQ